MNSDTPGDANADGPREIVAGICAAFPEVQPQWQDPHATFRVRRKPFAYFLDDHHGDGIVAVAVRAPLGQAADMIESDPRVYYSPAYVGPRGWVGVRLDLEAVDWDNVAQLIRDSYRLAAPVSLVRSVEP